MALNLLFLALIVVMPFATDLVAEYGDDPIGVVIYASVVGLASLLTWLMIRHSVRHGHVRAVMRPYGRGLGVVARPRADGDLPGLGAGRPGVERGGLRRLAAGVPARAPRRAPVPAGPGVATADGGNDAGDGRRLSSSASPAGGGARSSTRSTRAASRTPTATASATCRGRRAPRPPERRQRGLARRRRDLAVALLPLADGRLRLRRRRLHRRRPALRDPRRLRPADRRGPRARHPGDHRLGPQPLLRPPPLVPGLALLARRPQARLVRLARRAARRPAARPAPSRPSRASGRRGPTTRPPASGTGTSSPPASPTSTGPTRELAEAHARHAALLARPRRRRLPHRRGPPPRPRRPAAACAACWRSTTGAWRWARSTCSTRSGCVAFLVTGDGLHLAHNFVFLRTPWRAEAFRDVIDEFERLAGALAWPSWCLENHDHSRVATRYDEGGHGPARARVAGMMLLTLRGTAFLFQGQELGLPDARVPPEAGRGRRRPRPRARADPLGAALGRRPRGRLHHRDPVAADRRRRPRRLAWLGAGRRPALDPVAVPAPGAAAARLRPRCATATRPCSTPGDDVLAWTREGGGERWLVALNMSLREQATRDLVA